MKLFEKESKFVQSISKMHQFDQFIFEKPEIVFAGRSNAGKSSIINALVKKKELAHTSKKPGKTKTFNIFNLGGVMNLIDMPGYGYAFVSKNERDEWFQLILEYFKSNRPQLKQIYFLIDSRVGLKDSDIEMISMINTDKASIVMTKCDKLSDNQIESQANHVSAQLCVNNILIEKIFFTSSKTGYGMENFKNSISSFV